MGMAKDPRMREALRLARTGEKDQARQLLIEILRQTPNNFDAWVVMAQVTEDRKGAVICMKQALRLRPDDARAGRYLDYLLQDNENDNPPEHVSASEGVSTPERVFTPERVSAPEGVSAPMPVSAPGRVSPWLWGGLGIAGLVCLLAAAIFLVPGLVSQLQPAGIAQLATNLPIEIFLPTDISEQISTDTPMPPSTNTLQPDVATPTATNTQTPSPTATPSPTLTPSPTSTPSPTATTEAPPTATTDPLADPCAAFTFGAITPDATTKAVSVGISHPGGATLTNIMIAWSMGGSLDKIKHGNGFIANTSASNPPGTFAVSETIGTNDSLEFWFTIEPGSTGYTIILTFAGGCTRALPQG